jgi:hypothetical protein
VGAAAASMWLEHRERGQTTFCGFGMVMIMELVLNLLVSLPPVRPGIHYKLVDLWSCQRYCLGPHLPALVRCKRHYPRPNPTLPIVDWLASTSLTRCNVIPFPSVTYATTLPIAKDGNPSKVFCRMFPFKLSETHDPCELHHWV